ncbi:MAG: hydrogenase maturation protease, partial [Chloroflexota bacterium]|nr:hydrogenase maturation protease [Chloroflexota bacterium]
DGFGPQVVQHLTRHYAVPDDVCVMDAGTGVRNILFSLALSQPRPEELVIVDAVDQGGEPGSIVELPIEGIPLQKLDDFSMHQAPSSNLLRELQDQCGVRVTVFACDVGPVNPAVQPGLSSAAQRAVPVICQTIADRYFNV